MEAVYRTESFLFFNFLSFQEPSENYSISLEAKAVVKLNQIATSQASPEDIITNRESVSNESVAKNNGT